MINGKLTEFILRSISQRLASREDCKDLTYQVKIDDSGVHMDPIIYVYPNCHKRKDSDKLEIVSYVYQYKLEQELNLHELVYGTYEYSSIDNEKKRKWRKINEA